MLNRTLAIFLALSLAAMLLLGAVSLSVLTDTANTLVRERLTDAVDTVRAELASGASAVAAARSAAGIFTAADQVVRMTVIRTDGTVLADSLADPATMDNHLGRPEVAGALANPAGAWDTRYSDTLKQDMMYFAILDGAAGVVVRAAMPVTGIQVAGAALRLRIALLTGALFLLLLGIGLWSIRTVSRPIREMETAATAIAAGRYDLRVRRMLSDRSRIGKLSIAFNAMADRLEASVADLEEKSFRLDAILEAMETPVLSVDPRLEVTYRNAAARIRFGAGDEEARTALPLILAVRSRPVEELVRATVRAGARREMEWTQEADDGVSVWHVTASPLAGREGGALVVFQDMTEILRLQRIRTDFAANVTHELSTPLTAIRGFVETLRGGAVRDPELAARFLDILSVEAERLQRLIDDILSLSEIEGGSSSREPVAFDLNERIDRSVVLLEESAAKHGVALVAGPPREAGDAPAEEPEEPARLDVRADPDRIGQLLVNLLDNAVKYNRPGGTVWAWAERGRDGRVRLHVKDTGIGIAAEHRPRLFERFYRVDAGRSRETGGTGLGLSIVKHIALLYDGHVDVESEPGAGSEFIVTLGI